MNMGIEKKVHSSRISVIVTFGRSLHVNVIKSFLDGMRRIDVSGYHNIKFDRYMNGSDREDICNDWMQVGNDIRFAMNKFNMKDGK